MASPTAERPTGITILAVLAGVGGILMAIGGIALFVLGAVAFGGLGALLGIAFLAVAALYLAFCVGALQMKPWAWPLGVVGAGASIVLSALQLIGGDVSQIISIAIAGGILYYLTRPEIKAAFGQGGSAAPAPAAPAPTAAPPAAAAAVSEPAPAAPAPAPAAPAPAAPTASASEPSDSEPPTSA